MNTLLNYSLKPRLSFTCPPVRNAFHLRPSTILLVKEGFPVKPIMCSPSLDFLSNDLKHSFGEVMATMGEGVGGSGGNNEGTRRTTQEEDEGDNGNKKNYNWSYLLAAITLALGCESANASDVNGGEKTEVGEGDTNDANGGGKQRHERGIPMMPIEGGGNIGRRGK